MAPRQDWDFYNTHLHERPASVFVNLAASVDLSRPVRLQVLITLRRARPDGLSSSEEAPRLSELEDAIVSKLTAALDAEYVGRITSGGQRQLVLYAERDTELAQVMASVQHHFSEYPLDSTATRDPDWVKLCDELRPTPQQMQWIYDRRVVDQLAHHGDNPVLPRPVDHYVYFADAARRDAFVADVRALGFEAHETHDKGSLGAHLVRHDPVVLEHIHRVVLELAALAEKHGGDYDGWGAPIATSSP